VTCLVGGIRQEVRLVDQNGNKPLLNVLRQWRFGRDMVPGGVDANKDNPDFKVIIRGDEEMGYHFLEPVLITCAEASVRNVNFNTRKVIE
jgi:hypothetical protein